MSFGMSGPENMSLEMNIKNTGTIRYSDTIEIIAPTNTKDLQEFMNEIHLY